MPGAGVKAHAAMWVQGNNSWHQASFLAVHGKCVRRGEGLGNDILKKGIHIRSIKATTALPKSKNSLSRVTNCQCSAEHILFKKKN